MLRIVGVKRRLLPVALLILASVSLLVPWNGAAQVADATPVWMLYGSAPNAPDRELQAIVEDVISDVPGDWGIVIKKLDTGQFAEYNGGEQHVSASLYKLWVMGELYRQVRAGEIDLGESVIVTGEDSYYDTMLGELRLPTGTSVTLERVVDLMITLSDNTASHLLVRTVGPDNINRFISDLGLEDSVLDWSGVGDNLTTPYDVLHILELMATSRLVDADASARMINTMLGQQINNRLPVDLPEEARIAHKTGDLESLLHDAGIIYGPAGPFVIVAMSSNLHSNSHAFEAMPELARRVYDYFQENPSSPARYFPETRQTVGHSFLKFWSAYGGLETFGFPVGPQRVDGKVLVQDFERARFEFHPELAGTPGLHPEVALGLVGQELAQHLELSWSRSPNNGQGWYFEATGFNVEGDFLQYWKDHGGERVFGLPISPAEVMETPSDGKAYLTQWFQRARFEYHTESPVGKRVVLGALVSEQTSSR